MKHRCYECKHLEDESAKKFYERTRVDFCAKFFCKACQKNTMPESACEGDVKINFTSKIVEISEFKPTNMLERQLLRYKANII